MNFEWASLLLAPLTGVVTYWVTKKQKDNDFLRQLQESINMLVDENTKLLAENVALRNKVADLQVNQEKLMIEIRALKRRIDGGKVKGTNMDGGGAADAGGLPRGKADRKRPNNG